MNKSELAETLGVSRMTINRWEKQGVLKDKLAEHYEANVTPIEEKNVTSENVTPDVTLNVTLRNDWEKNENPLTGRKFASKEEAIATAIGMVTKGGATIMLNGELYGWKGKPKRKL